jgi:TRAP-type C4-dicarboxylate transport system permease small subunit
MNGPIDRASHGAGEILKWLFLLSATCTWYEVAARFVFRAPTLWANEIVVACCAVCFLFGGAVCMRQNQHIRIGYLIDRGATARRISLALSLACALVFLAALIYGGWTQFVESIWNPHIKAWKLETTGRAWNVPIPPVIKVVLLAAAVLLLAQAVLTYGRLIAGPPGEARPGA